MPSPILASTGPTFTSPRGCPVTLPAHWTVEVDRHDLVFVQAHDAQGHALGLVTVDEIARNFVLGHTLRVPDDTARKGRGWQARLFQDAIAALHAAVVPHPDHGIAHGTATEGRDSEHSAHRARARGRLVFRKPGCTRSVNVRKM